MINNVRRRHANPRRALGIEKLERVSHEPETRDTLVESYRVADLSARRCAVKRHVILGTTPEHAMDHIGPLECTRINDIAIRDLSRNGARTLQGDVDTDAGRELAQVHLTIGANAQ